MECTSRINFKTPSTFKCEFSCMMTNKTKIITASPPTYVKVEKSSIQELETPKLRLPCVVLIHFSCVIQLKDIFPHGLTPFSGQDEQSYSVFLFLPF